MTDSSVHVRAQPEPQPEPAHGMPLRVRLTFWYGTALAVILLTFATVLYVEMDRELNDQVDGSLEEEAKAAVH